jgi:hypothetical protein
MISQLLVDNSVIPCVVQPDGDGVAVVCPLRVAGMMRELLTTENFRYIETVEKDYVVFAISYQEVLT